MYELAEQTGRAPGNERWGIGARAQRARPALDLLISLTESDLRARYGRGPWRLIKWLLDPFALVGVYLVLVSVVLHRGGLAPGLSLACAVVPFQLVMMAAINGLNAVGSRRAIIANMAFRRTFIPIAATLTEAVAFGASLVLIATMMAVYAVAPTLAVLWLPVVVGANLAVALSAAYATSLLGLWLADLRPFLVSFVRTLFFLGPGLVTLDQITGVAQNLVRLNPMTGIFEAYRAVLLYGHSPAAWQIVFPLAAAAAVGAIFVPLYLREQGQFAKVVG
jgi:lipopolysaccharide transport system permease protein